MPASADGSPRFSGWVEAKGGNGPLVMFTLLSAALLLAFAMGPSGRSPLGIALTVESLVVLLMSPWLAAWAANRAVRRQARLLENRFRPQFETMTSWYVQGLLDKPGYDVVEAEFAGIRRGVAGGPWFKVSYFGKALALLVVVASMGSAAGVFLFLQGEAIDDLDAWIMGIAAPVLAGLMISAVVIGILSAAASRRAGAAVDSAIASWETRIREGVDVARSRFEPPKKAKKG